MSKQQYIRRWQHPVNPRFGEAGAFLEALGREQKRLDIIANDLLRQRFVDTASHRELERLGREVQCPRQAGEGDERYRLRVKASYAQAMSKATYDDFAQVVAIIFEGNEDSFALTRPFDESPATVIVNVEQSVIDEHPLNADEISELLEEAVPASHRVEIRMEGSFAFDGTASGKGFNEGTWSGSA